MSAIAWPVLAWWLALLVIGWAALPLSRRLFAVLPDQGLGFTRPLGLLLAGYVYWLGGITGLVPNTVAGAWFAALAVVALGGWLGWRDRAGLLDFLRQRRRLVLGYEALFLVAFVGWALYRAYYPNIETAGGEKYMELTFINSILASSRFPPHDAWMAGHTISYYYFGYVMAALMIRLTGLLSSVGITLVVPMTLAMTLSGAFGLGYDLVGLVAGSSRRARVATGALTGLLLALVGNLYGFLELAFKRGWGPASAWNWLDIRNLTVGPGTCHEAGEGFGAGGWLPTRFIWWWRGSRVIQDQCAEVIHEFPFFSFMLADAHPHLLGLPFTLLVLGLALAVLAGALERGPDRPLWSPRWLALPLAVGALGFLNAWDLPTFAFVVVVAYALRAWRRPAWDGQPGSGDVALAAGASLAVLYGLWRLVPRLLGAVLLRATGTETTPNALPTQLLVVVLWASLMVGGYRLWQRARAGDEGARRWLDVGRFGIWLVGLALLFYLPFHYGFRSQVTGIGAVDVRSRIGQWLVHFGLLTFLGATLVIVYGRLVARSRWSTAQWVVLGLGAAAGVAALLLQAWTALFLAVVVGAAGVVGLGVWSGGAAAAEATDDEPAMPVAPTFALLCVAVGLLLPLGTEFLFIRDLFGSRMNTVFKLYFQAWTLLSVAGAYTVFAVWRRWPRVAAAVWAVPLGALVLASLVYPVAAVISRTNHFTVPTYAGVQGLTLDGLAWWQDQYPEDVAVVDWLRANASGAPVILEAPGGGYSHHGRIAMATGFPTVMGWDGHEHQWRGERTEIGPQKADAVAMYTTDDPAELLRLLAKYDVRYVIVGDWERGNADLQLTDADLQRFERVLKPVFRTPSGRTVIFERQG